MDSDVTGVMVFNRKSIPIEGFLFTLFIFAMPFGAGTLLSLKFMGFNITIAQLLILSILTVICLKGVISGFNVRFVFHSYLLLMIFGFTFSLINFLYIPIENMMFDLKTSLHLFIAILLILVTMRVVNNFAYLDKLLFVLLIGVVCLSILTILKTYGVPIPGYMRRVQYEESGIGVVALFNGVMPFSLTILGGFAICLKRAIESKMLKIALVIIIVVAAVCSYSRSLWVALFAQIMLAYYFQYSKERRYYIKYAAVFAMIMIIVFCTIFHAEIASVVYNIRPSTVTGRLESILLGFKIMSSDVIYWLFGIGEGYFIQSSFNATGRSFVIHNFLLKMFICRGLITAVCVFSFISIIVWHLNVIRNKIGIPSLFKRHAEMFILCVIGLCVEGMFSPIVGSIIFWTYLAIACAFISVAKGYKITDFKVSYGVANSLTTHREK